MYIAGEWFKCLDSAVRPVIRAEMRGENGTWVEVPFLVDTGADRTVLSAQVFRRLGVQPLMALQQLAGVGGIVQSFLLNSAIHFTIEGGRKVPVRGQFAAVNDVQALDMSVLGRDVLGLFAVIVDQPGNTVSLINQSHGYSISSN